ncbi:MAG: hypothetical protein LQ339_001114 [Xanthoria mediterranea]|nr:MAG: hypothetical protein LQ339_001114 [Xanthoria mediterranea]
MAMKIPDSKPDGVQLMLRKVAIGAAAVGVFLNTISIIYSSTKRGQHSMVDLTGFAFLPLGLSLVWNHLILFTLSKVKNDMVEALLLVADIAFFLGFVAVSVGNGVVMNHLGGWNRGWGLGVDHVVLYTYNSVPWLTCGSVGR